MINTAMMIIIIALVQHTTISRYIKIRLLTVNSLSPIVESNQKSVSKSGSERRRII